MTTTAPAPSTGFIGLGVMGRPMALHQTNAGFDVHVNSRRRASAQELDAAGATWHATPRELAASVDAVVLMVPDFPDVRAILDGDDGLLAGIHRDLLVIVCSTVSPEDVKTLAAELTERTQGRVRLVDAPVSGGEEGAKDGTLSIMVGGEPADAELAIRVLAPCGNPVHLGPLGAGQVAKACNQLIVAATVTALSEAAVIGERAGLDLAKLFGLLQGGYAGSRIMEVKGHRLATHDHSPSGPAKFMIKDLRFAADAAKGSGTVTPLLETLRQVFTSLTDAGMGDNDTAVVQAWIESLTPAAPH